MIRRVLWLGVGLAVGVVVARQVRRIAHAYAPAQVAGSARNSAAALLTQVRDFVSDVVDGMAEREEQIRAAFAEGVSLTDLEDAGPTSGLHPYDWAGADWTEADWSGADWGGAGGDGIDFDEADLGEADLDEAEETPHWLGPRWRPTAAPQGPHHIG
jgi:uncharacterized protein YjbI with pentapeptide repeats